MTQVYAHAGHSDIIAVDNKIIYKMHFWVLLDFGAEQIDIICLYDWMGLAPFRLICSATFMLFDEL